MGGQKGGREGKRRSSVDAREPRNPTKSEEYQKHLPRCVVRYMRGTNVQNAEGIRRASGGRQEGVRRGSGGASPLGITQVSRRCNAPAAPPPQAPTARAAPRRGSPAHPRRAAAPPWRAPPAGTPAGRRASRARRPAPRRSTSAPPPGGGRRGARGAGGGARALPGRAGAAPPVASPVT
eukprot:1189332-Prorocentrum_minimum.AAC.4